MSPRASWIGLTEAEVASRVGRRLGIRFGPREPIGFGGWSDATYAMNEDDWIVLEVEHSQTHPEGNVLKYWPWLERNKRRAILIHAIAPDARKQRGARTELTRWLGRRMERSLRGRFWYCRVHLGAESELSDLETARAAIATIRLVGSTDLSGSNDTGEPDARPASVGVEESHG